MSDFSDILKIALPVILAAGLSWLAASWHGRQKARKVAEDRGDRLEIHKDELTFEILRNARQEVLSTRLEMDDVRFEMRKLRKMETHFFHFQQSLDHLEALLSAEDGDARAAAERAAKAFLNRMRRLNEAKGTIAEEVQRVDSAVEGAIRDIDAMNEAIKKGETP